MKLYSYRLIKSNDVLVKSTIAPVGRAKRPIVPIPKPLKKPDAPLSLAPAIGFVTTPVKPPTKPYFIKELNMKYSKDFPLTFKTSFPPVAITAAALAPGSLPRLREFLTSSSNVIVAKLFPTTPVIFDTAPAAPPKAEPNNVLTPVATPSANSIGPSIAPFKQSTNQFLFHSIQKFYFIWFIEK